MNEKETDDSILPASWMAVVPESGKLSPGCSAQLKIAYFPGQVREFYVTFMLEVFFASIHLSS